MRSSKTIGRSPNVIAAHDRGGRVTSIATTQPGGLLDREDLLQMLDRAVTKQVTVISAPPGSGKTSLLRAWTARSTGRHRVAFVSVARDQQDAQQFWSAVLNALRNPAVAAAALDA